MKSQCEHYARQGFLMQQEHGGVSSSCRRGASSCTVGLNTRIFIFPRSQQTERNPFHDPGGDRDCSRGETERLSRGNPL